MNSQIVRRREESLQPSSAALHYRVTAWWSSGKAGLAKSDSAPNAIHFTAPPEFGGLEGRWTPEDLLLGAVASCYTTTFRALADSSQLEYLDLGVEVDGTVAKTESGYSFGQITIRSKLTISKPEEESKSMRLLHKAESVCLVSRSLSVEPVFEPSVCVRGSTLVRETV
jgi:peroxiredoxin-like protein